MTNHYFIYENRRDGKWDVMQLLPRGYMPLCLKQCSTHKEALAFIKLLKD